MRPGSAVRLENRIEDISVPTKTATTLGLIVNELCSNAVKYGSDGAPETPMTLTLAMTRDAGEYTLTVSNTGRPFPVFTIGFPDPGAHTPARIAGRG